MQFLLCCGVCFSLLHKFTKIFEDGRPILGRGSWNSRTSVWRSRQWYRTVSPHVFGIRTSSQSSGRDYNCRFTVICTAAGTLTRSYLRLTTTRKQRVNYRAQGALVCCFSQHPHYLDPKSERCVYSNHIHRRNYLFSDTSNKKHGIDRIPLYQLIDRPEVSSSYAYEQ